MSIAVQVSLKEFFAYCSERSLPFAFYRLPETRKIMVIAQHAAQTRKLSTTDDLTQEKGFLFAPFHSDRHHSKILIKADVFCDTGNLPDLTFAIPSGGFSENGENRGSKLIGINKKQFIEHLKKIRKKIRNGLYKKIVAARIEITDSPKSYDAVDYFRLLCNKYPEAFISLVHTKEYGLWIGASPEILLAVSKGKYMTYSLAGTQENTKGKFNHKWGKKEKEEQKIVSDYIARSFGSFTKEKPSVRGPITFEAGNLLHMRTTFTYRSIPYSHWQKVVELLHPTPAVAGYPKNNAIKYILKNEKAPRSFYSGYLGPVNIGKEVNLFVNLRCMKVLKNKLVVYVGCGITSDSIFTDEWKETEMKAETLLNLLER